MNYAYPTEKQQEVLSQWIGCQRLIYNTKVAEDHYFCTFRTHPSANRETHTTTVLTV